MSVVIGGGSGFVGRHLTKMLIERGFKVTIVSRTSKPNQMTWKDVENNGLPEGCTAVVNVAGENILNPFKRYSNKSFRDEIWKSRIDTTLCLAKAIRNAEKAPEVFVTMSGVGFYPPSKTAVYTESSPGGDDWLAELSHDWEVAGNLPQTLPTRRVVVRSGTILSGDGGMIRIRRELLKGKWRNLPLCLTAGDKKEFFPWIHIKDVVAMIVFAIERPTVRGVLNGVAPDTIQEITRKAIFILKVVGPCVRATWPNRLMLLLIQDRSSFVFGILMRFLFEERAALLLEGRCVKPKRVLRLGYNFYFPTFLSAVAEIEATIEEMEKI